MTLEKQIEILKEWHKRAGTEMYLPIMSSEDIDRFLHWLEDYKQLKADYIELDNQIRKANTENDELKRLLRLAVEDLDIVMTRNKHIVCKNLNRETNDCDYDDICVWRYQDEAMKLLGGAENAEN